MAGRLIVKVGTPEAFKTRRLNDDTSELLLKAVGLGIRPPNFFETKTQVKVYFQKLPGRMKEVLAELQRNQSQPSQQQQAAA